MRTTPLGRSLLAVAVTCLALGCRADTTGLQTLSVQELVAQQAAEPDLILCDANNADTRTRYGVVPGATLLSNYRDYDPATELPSARDQRVVFYCHSPSCSAAADAARKAVAAGYTSVSVMPAGIKGWVDAGHRVVPPPAS